ncbi:MAG: DUF4262 domain-containing protein [Actinomycetota bacterium]
MSGEPDPPQPSLRVEYDPADFQLDHAEAVAAIIDLQGYAVEPVRADADRGRPAYAYTIGVEDLLGHPELVAVGLDGEFASRLFTEFVDHLRSGGELPVSQPFVGMLGGELPCVLLPVDVGRHADWFAGAADHFSFRPFRMLQLVYPDAAGRFPWDPEADPQVVATQRVLGE